MNTTQTTKHEAIRHAHHNGGILRKGKQAIQIRPSLIIHFVSNPKDMDDYEIELPTPKLNQTKTESFPVLAHCEDLEGMKQFLNCQEI